MNYPNAIWSGYQLSVQSFKEFMQVLVGDRECPNYCLSTLVLLFNGWKKERGLQAPVVRYRSDTEEGDTTHLFFQVRHIKYRNAYRLKVTDPAYITASTPTVKDKEILESWLNYVNKEKNLVSADVFEFATMVDMSPEVDWRTF